MSKCTPPELLIPALKAKKLVLVGDHRQLPPMIDNSTIAEIAEEIEIAADELSYLQESLLKIFLSLHQIVSKPADGSVPDAPSNHGSNQSILWKDRLECGLENPDLDSRPSSRRRDFTRHPKSSVATKLQHRNYHEIKQGNSYINKREVEIIKKLCQQFEEIWANQIKQGKPRKEVGIITFYGAQLRLIEKEINRDIFPSLHIRTGTVDRFQGMEKQIIIVSMVRNNDRNDIGFAKSQERVNVAFSRSKSY